jgi:hypothetical protein
LQILLLTALAATLAVEGGPSTAGVVLARPMKAAVVGALRNSVWEEAVVGHQRVEGEVEVQRQEREAGGAHQRGAAMAVVRPEAKAAVMAVVPSVTAKAVVRRRAEGVVAVILACQVAGGVAYLVDPTFTQAAVSQSGEDQNTTMSNNNLHQRILMGGRSPHTH